MTGVGNISTVSYAWGLTIDPTTNRAFVIGAANTPNDNIASVDLASRSNLLTFPVGGNGEARASWFDPASNDLWVPYLNSNLGTFDTASGNLLQNVQVGVNGTQAAPYSVAYDPSTNRLWVTDFFNSEVSVVNPATDQVVASVSTGAGSWPYWIVLDPSTQLAFVTDTGSNTLHVLNTSTDTLVANLPVADLTYSSEALDPAHHLVYVSGSSGSLLTVIQENPLKVLTTLPTVGQVFGVAVDPTLNLLATTGFSTQGEVYCASTLAPVASLPYAVPSPYQIAFDPALDLLAVDQNPSSGPGQLALFDVSGAASTCASPPPPPPTLQATSSASPTQGTAPLTVSFTASASGGTAPYTYSWSFGDGSTSTLQDPSHTYSSAGSYSAVVSVDDSAGGSATAPPIFISLSAGGGGSGGGSVTGVGNISTVSYAWGLTIDPTTNRAFVIGAANTPNDNIASVDLASRSNLLTFPVGGNGEARASWFDPASNDLWVPYLNSNLGTFDTASGNLLQNVQVGVNGTQAAPYSVAYDPSTNRLWVTDFFNSEVSVVNPATDQVVASVSTGAGSWPYWIVLDPSTQLAFVTDTGSNTLHVLNTSTDTLVANLPVADLTYSSEALDPAHHLVYVSGSSGSLLTVIQENPLKVLTTLPTVGQVFGVAVDPTLNLLATTGFSTQGEVYCASTLAPVASLPYAVPSPYQIAFDPALDLLAVDQNPSSGPGQLALFDVSGAASTCASPPPPPPTLQATSSASPTQGTAPLTVSFTASASGGTAPYTYSWSFGDGSTSTLQDPSHTYSSAGSYSAVLSVSDSSGQSAQALPILVSVSGENRTTLLTLSISVSSITGPAPLTVGLVATPSGGQSPYTVKWVFGDGGVATGLQTSHTYTVPGSYQLFASVTDANGDIAAISPVPVTITPSNDTGNNLGSGLTISATASVGFGEAPVSVTFVASAAGGTAPYTFVWSFGDQSSGIGAQVSHTYTSAGDYLAQVSVTDAHGNFVASHGLTVRVQSSATGVSGSSLASSSGPALSIGLASMSGLGVGLGYPILANRPSTGSSGRSRFSVRRRL